jgi:hypothetical protein
MSENEWALWLDLLGFYYGKRRQLHPTVAFAQQSNKFGLAITTAPGIATIKVAVIPTSRGVEAGVHTYIRTHPCQLSRS